MDIELEVPSLAAETMAFQAIITSLLQSLHDTDPTLQAAVERSLDIAARMVELTTLRHGQGASPEHTLKALAIVESTRKSVVQPRPPKHAI